jgi:hypothetical protein
VVADVGTDLGAGTAALAAIGFKVERAQMVAGGGPLGAVGASGKCNALVFGHWHSSGGVSGPHSPETPNPASDTGSVAAGVAAAALVATVALVLLAVVAAVLLSLGDCTVATHHRTLLLLGHGDLLRLDFADRAGSLPTTDRNENL